jgi:hypothetical protein
MPVRVPMTTSRAANKPSVAVVWMQQSKQHERDGRPDPKGMLASHQIAEPAEHQRAERTHRKSGREGRQREDETSDFVDARRELRGEPSG